MTLLIFLQEQPADNATFDWTSLVTWLLIILGFIVNYFLLNRSYKHDYYKRLIEKRLINYQMAEKILSHLQLWNHNKNIGTYHSFFSTPQTFETFAKEVIQVCEEAFWLTENLYDKFLEFNGTLFEISLVIHQLESQRIGVSYFQKLNSYSKEIKKMLYEDFQDLHEIENFLKTKVEETAKY